MNSNHLKSIFAAAAVCSSGLLAVAAPLKRADVTTNPAWLLHLDCDALRPTIIGQYVLSEADKPEAKAKLEAFQTIFQIDLRTQLHGVTVYSDNPSPEDGVLIIYADFDPARLVTLAQAAKDYQSSEHGSVIIHSWIDEKKSSKDGVKPRTYAAINGKRVVFGQREDAVSRALKVISGSSPNLASVKNFPELGVSGSNSFIEAAARKMKLPDSDPNAAILKMSQSLQLALGESQQKLNARITLVADSREVATNVLSIVQGLVSLVKMQNDKPESIKVANAISLAQEGDRVVANLVLPASEAVEFMKADAARKAALAEKASKE